MTLGSREDRDFKNFKELDRNTSARFVTGETSSTSVTSFVAISATSVLLLASNPLRLGAVFVNNTIREAFIKYGTTAGLTDFTERLEAGDTLVIDQDLLYTGRLDVIWDGIGGGGGMQITGLTR